MPANGTSDLAALKRRRDALAVLKEVDPSDEIEQALRDVDAEIGPTNSRRAVTWGALNKTVAFLMENIAPVIRGFVRTELVSRDQRLDALEARMDALAEWKDVGVWDSGAEYRVHNHCSHNGSSWVCLSDHRGCEPGVNSGGTWRLTVKRGRHGRRNA